jgi:hypothetical protein
MLDVIKILEAANEFSLQEFIDYLQSYLIENKSYWMEQNFTLIYKTSFEHDSFLELQKFCTDLIYYEPEKIFNSPDFTSIPEKSFISLIRNDNLKMSEIQVWEHVLKWGFAQNPELPSDPTSFSKEDFNVLRKTLRQCIPFVKFHNLTSKEFMDKVLPYEEILPKELYKDLLKAFLSLLDSNSKLNDKSEPQIITTTKKINLKTVDSKIITYQHAELISKWIKWIEKLDITDNIKNPHEFKLLLRGSRDGFTRGKFHDICDNQPRTVTIVKVKGSSEILGGYNPIKWKSDGEFGVTKDSFIFSFKNKVNIGNYILSRVIDEKKAIRNSILYGPSFGNSDLIICGFSLYTDEYSRSSKASYEKPIRQTVDDFSVEECEIFQVV